jgi:prophage regulatory protein
MPTLRPNDTNTRNVVAMSKQAAKGGPVLRLPEVVKRTSLSPATIWRRVKAGTFPQPFKITERATGWFEHELDEWLKERAAQHREAQP